MLAFYGRIMALFRHTGCGLHGLLAFLGHFLNVTHALSLTI
jgi:hypothetical protein